MKKLLFGLPVIGLVMGAVWAITPFGLAILLGGILKRPDIFDTLFVNIFAPILLLPNVIGGYIAALVTCSHPTPIFDMLIRVTQPYGRACFGGCCDNITGVLLSLPLTLLTGALIGGFIGLILMMLGLIQIRR